MNFTKDILEAIKQNNSFDGTHYQITLDDVSVDDGNNDALSVILDNDNLVVLLIDNEEKMWCVPFNELTENDQIAIYVSIFGYKTGDIDDFFEFAQYQLTGGDKMVVSFEEDEDGQEDYDNLVYTIYGGCNNKMAEYHTKYEILIKF